ncbi:hypothetical protein CDAR_308711 [Caerostris darwini]|uniref:Uncharacterized protein n=1 Tax=Caerostris darwini TaxID=1538125 RepID=A0AAV4NUM0_9ARAC|nr:hypothetical protein CDAR_308711 [Caerostris darwini]
MFLVIDWLIFPNVTYIRDVVLLSANRSGEESHLAHPIRHKRLEESSASGYQKRSPFPSTNAMVEYVYLCLEDIFICFFMLRKYFYRFSRKIFV